MSTASTDCILASEVSPWALNSKFPESIDFAIFDRGNIFVFAKKQLFLVDFASENDALPILAKSSSDLFAEISTIRSVPNTSIVVFSTRSNPTELVIHDYEKSSILQRAEVEAEVKGIECFDSLIAVSIPAKTLLYAWNGKQCRKVKELPGSAEVEAAVRGSDNGEVLVYHNENARMCAFSVTEKKQIGSSGFAAREIVVNADGSRIYVKDDASQWLYIFDTEKIGPYRDVHLNYGRLLNVISDDERCFVMVKDNQYTIATLNYDVDSKKPSVSFVFHFSAEMFEHSLAFVRVDGVQHLQCVTKDGVLQRYQIDEEWQSWNLV